MSIKESDIPAIFVSLEYMISQTDNLIKEYYFIISEPCKDCLSKEKTEEEESCPNKHRYFFFIIKAGQRSLLTFYGHENEYGDFLCNRFLANSEVLGIPNMIEGFDWTGSVEKYHYTTKPLTEELKITISQKFQKLIELNKKIGRLDSGEFTFILKIPNNPRPPYQLLIFDKDDPRVQEELNNLKKNS